MKILKHIHRAITAMFFVAVASSVVAEERRYGSFVHNPGIPNALFFMDLIKDGDDFELRKALRNHDIDTIVLASPGGSVWAGLSMAGIIFDKKLRVFVPPKALCASACSYMFFGGNERLSEGALGVHQFASSDQKQTANAVKIQAQSQFTVSEIIGFLNEFDTPRFVFERMFEDREMYWFNSEETAQLNSAEFALETKIQSAVSSYTSNKLNEAKVEVVRNPQYSKKELIALIQKKLNEIGCLVGAVDGIWGLRTNAAAVQFAGKAGLSTSKVALISKAFLDALVNAKKSFCLKPKTAPETFASIYEYSCNGGPVFNDVWSIVRHDKRNRVVYMRTIKGETETFTYTGKRFKTSEGMEGQFFFTEEGHVYKFTYGNQNCSRIIFESRE
tara:strand:- start:5672 stop:6835 length:1164 start_codon:yes stop_codon:yes gene_type:complete